MRKKDFDETCEKSIEEVSDILGLGLSMYPHLKRIGPTSVEDLTLKKDDEIERIKNFGKKSLEEVTAKLETIGLSFNPNEN